ncbi:MAG TPA: hypothetical protein VFA30_06650 [Gaiellaceae bacterium]|nr:hypothetical protein [Gaiellaceae bacterium]
MSRGSASVLAATGAISAVTAAARAGAVPLRALAATPQAVLDGRIWLLATSAVVADRPAAASILGFLVVGLVVVRLCGPRVAWAAGAGGHVVSALVLYAALGATRLVDPDGVQDLLHLPDFGTSAVIAAWIGAVACVLWQRGRRTEGVALVVVSGLVGWYLKGALDALDAEHVVALAVGAAAVRLRPGRVPRLRPTPAHS